MLARIVTISSLALSLVACQQQNSSTIMTQQDGTLVAMERYRPFVIAEADGVKLWKVRDGTNGGPAWVYFTTGGAQWSTGGKSPTHYIVPSVPNN